MLYLANVQSAQTVRVPNTAGLPGVGMRLVIRGTVSLETVVDTFVSDTAPGLYYTFPVTLPAGITDGSYEYELSMAGEIISKGCLTIGSYDHETKEYEKEITYGQYGS